MFDENNLCKLGTLCWRAGTGDQKFCTELTIYLNFPPLSYLEKLFLTIIALIAKEVDLGIWKYGKYFLLINNV